MDKYNKLDSLNTIIHYSGPIVFAFITLFLSVGMLVSGFTRGLIIPLVTAFFTIYIYAHQKERLRFKFIPLEVSLGECAQFIKYLQTELKWTLRKAENSMFVLKTHPSLTNYVWGHHVTIVHTSSGLFVNSIHDPNKGSRLISFGNNLNVDQIRRIASDYFATNRASSPIERDCQ